MSKSLTTTKTARVVLSQDFDHARKCLTAAKSFVQQGAGFMLLAGVELKRLKTVHGVKRGGDRKSDQTRNGAGLTWAKLVERELGISEDTAARYILMAESSKERVKVLKELETKLLAAPLHSLPEATQERVIKAVNKLCDGKTGKEVMQSLGIAKADPGSNLAKDRNKGGNSTAAKLTAEERAQEHFHSITQTFTGLRLDASDFDWMLYHLPLDLEPDQTVNDCTTLTSLHDELSEWLARVKEAKDRVTKAHRASHTPDAIARAAEARAKALQEAGIKDPAVVAAEEAEAETLSKAKGKGRNTKGGKA